VNNQDDQRQRVKELLQPIDYEEEEEVDAISRDP
jgi:hypothetical protein